METQAQKNGRELMEATAISKFKKISSNLNSEIWMKFDKGMIGGFIRQGNIIAAAGLATEVYFRTRTHQNAALSVILNTMCNNNTISEEIIRDCFSRNRSVLNKELNNSDPVLAIFYRIYEEFEERFGWNLKKIESIGYGAIPPIGDRESLDRWPSFENDTLTKMRALLVDSFVKINKSPPSLFLGKDELILSMGSCFAVNINKGFAKIGQASEVVQINEQLNNTFAIRELSRIMANSSKYNGAIDSLLGSGEAGKIGKAYERSSLVIVTLGVSAIFVSSDTGLPYFGKDLYKKILKNEVTQRILTAEESFNLLCDIYKNLSSRSVPVVFSLSPVPLIRTFNGGSNILLDDINSKLNLRSAIIRLVAENSNCFYWPSFEVVKWFGAHFQTFGDDNDSRHVNQEIIDLITGEFIKMFTKNPE